MEHPMHQDNCEATHADEKQLNRRERRRAETRERIVRSALHLFSEHGVAATTVEDITNAADIGKGTFFNYFPSKEDILAHLCQLQMGKIRELVSSAANSTDPMELVLYELSMTLVAEFSRSPTLVQSILAAVFSSDSARQQMAANIENDRVILADLMEARQARGDLRNDFTPNELAFQFQRALFGTTVLWSLDQSKPLSDCLKEMVRVLWSGIRTEKRNSLQK